MEAPNEKDASRMEATWAKFVDSQTLIAVQNQEASKLYLNSFFPFFH
jgi:hypothetical protein